jgi:hypothetical protein
MYRIVITKEEDVVSTQQEWQQLYIDQDTAEANGTKHTHGYVDKKVEVVKETKVLDQRVEDMDLNAVIVAVNNLGGVAADLIKIGKLRQGDSTNGSTNATTEA